MSLELKLAIKVKQRMSYEGRDMKTIEKEILIYQWLSVGEMVKHIEGERAFWVFLLFCSCIGPRFLVSSGFYSLMPPPPDDCGWGLFIEMGWDSFGGKIGFGTGGKCY